jgi:hypothetical protein
MITSTLSIVLLVFEKLSELKSLLRLYDKSQELLILIM